jgi:MATE family multidrug resistance protein
VSKAAPFFREARATLVLAVPMIAGQLSQMLMGLIDAAMVGRVGIVSLAAAAFANSLLAVPMLISIGLLTAVSVQVSQAHGAGRREEIGEVLRHGLVLSIAAGFSLAALVWMTSFHLGVFDQPPEVVAAARRYFIISGASLLPMLLTLTVKQFSEALSHPVPPMLVLIGAVFLNAACNWVLIYGHFGAPALGLEGAAWATLFARTASFLALLVYVRRARRFDGLAPMRWVGALALSRFASMLRLGGPAAGMLLLEVSAFSFAAIMVGWLGAAALAAHQIALSCASTTFMLPLGISLAVSIRVGQAVGANEFARVRTIGLSAFALGVTMMALCGLVFALAGVPIARAFVHDEAVSSLAARLLLAVAAFQVFDGLQVVAAGALRGLSDLTVPMILCIVAYWCVELPAAWVLAFPLHMGPLGVWLGLALGLACAAIMLAARFAWRTNTYEMKTR